MKPSGSYLSKQCLVLVLVTSASMLTGCGGSTVSSEPPRLEPAPSELTAPCEKPVRIPGPLGRGATESYWLKDRANLVTCADRHDALIEFYEDRDSRIAGNE